MSTAVGGGLRKVKISGRTFKVPADHDPARKLGGAEASVTRNGDGSVSVTQEDKAWSMTVQVRINDDEGDHEFLQQLQDKGKLVPCKFEFRNAAYGGKGLPVGELSHTGQANVMELTIEGEDKLERI
jgi:hypothetical protein